MKKTPMIIGIVLLILCVGGYFGVKAYNANEEKKEEAKTMTPISITASEVTGMSYVYDGAVLTFHKDGENWVYSEDTSIDINEETIDGMIEDACKVTSTQMVTAENLSDYGFDTPETTVTLTTVEGTTEIVVGMYNEILSQYYMNINGSMDMYLVGSEFKNTFVKSLESLTVVETEETESTESETAEGTEAESTEGEAVEGTKAESADSAESEAIEDTEAKSTDSAESEVVEGTEAENADGAEGEAIEGTEAESTDGAEGEVTEETENVEDTETAE